MAEDHQRNSVILIDAMALAVILYGAVEAFSALWIRLTSSTGDRRRAVWLRFARWLVAGLTFQLAADIIETATAPTWDDIGRLAAIAVVRTILNYFLERDLAELRERRHGKGGHERQRGRGRHEPRKLDFNIEAGISLVNFEQEG